jgi:hypothetical protein
MKYWSFALVLVACGGAGGTPLLEGGASDDATSGSDAQQGSDAQPGNDAQPVKDAGPNCQALLADLEQKRQAAVQCCLTCGTLQCTQQIEGLCCPLTVTSGDSLASKAYENALQAVKDANCQINCPPNTCSSKPTDLCQQSGTCLQ